MKIYKIFLAIFTLTLSNSIVSKVYFDNEGKKLFMKEVCDNEVKYFVSTDFPVLDICIFLDKYKFSKFNDEKEETWNCRSKNNSDGFRLMLANFTKKEEAVIASSNMIREILYQSEPDSSKTNDYSYGQNMLLHKQVLKDLNQDKWLKLITNDKEFVILIPKNKYPTIKNVTQKNIKEIDKIGLNSEILQELQSIDNKFCSLSEKEQQERINKIAEKTPELKRLGLIAHETLLNIFSDNENAKKIMKRVYLAGHGMYQEQMKSNVSGNMQIKTLEEIKESEMKREKNACIAQLWPDQYVALLERLNKTSCSFLYVNSCYCNGFNALTCQNANFYNEKNIYNKFELAKKTNSFITVLEPLPETFVSIGGEDIQISDFFIAINSFFEHEYSCISKSRNDLSETDILTGKIVELKEINELTQEKTFKISEVVSLIEQKPWLIDSISSISKKIGKDNTSARFPGMPFFRVCMPDINYLQDQLNCAGDFAPCVNSAKINILLFNTNKELDINNSRMSYEDKLKLVFEKAKQENLEDTNDEEITDYIKHGESTPTKIDSIFLIKKEQIIKNKTQYFETGSRQILAYPSIINLQIKLYGAWPKIISMIPGRAQHYIKEIVLFEKDKTNFDTIFVSGQEATKLYFIQELYCPKDNSKLKNLVIKTTKIENKDVTEYIYQAETGKYHNKNGEIDEEAAKNIIEKWILETQPAQEAIYEATSGIEDTNDFKIKINEIFPNLLEIKPIKNGATPEQKEKNRLATEQLVKKMQNK